MVDGRDCAALSRLLGPALPQQNPAHRRVFGASPFVAMLVRLATVKKAPGSTRAWRRSDGRT